MATSDQKEDPRLGFLRNSNRKFKVIDGDHLLRVALSSAPSSDETRSPPCSFGIPCNTDCVAESSQASNPALGASSSSRDLMDSSRHIPAPNQQQHQNKKTEMNDAPTSEATKGGSNTTPISRLSKQEKEIGGPPKHTTRATSRTPESKQLKPLKDPDGSVRSTISRIRASLNFVQKKEKTKPPKNSTNLVEKNENLQPPKNPTAVVENGGTSTILASRQGLQKKKTAQASKDPVEMLKNNGTSRMGASKHVEDKRETAQPPKDTAALVRNTGTSKIPASGHSTMQKKETTRSPKDSAKSDATTSKIPVQKQSEEKKNGQPSKGTSGLVSRTGTVRALRSNLASQEKESITAKPIRQNQITYHRIMWKGFDESIVPFEKSCPLCECDLAEDPEYPDVEHLCHVENAVLSCGHVFHSLCLRLATSEENSRDPPCIICFSLL